jgi:hypothetical protein
MNHCRVERDCLITHGSLNMATGETTTDHSERVVRSCGSPLFNETFSAIGCCKSCLEGWTHPNNFPTERGLQQIEQALEVLTAPKSA